jgi:hypothetical protein
MSANGFLTADELVSFASNGRIFQLNNVAAPWWELFADEIELEFGIRPTITWSDSGLTGTGAYRTAALQRKLNPAVSPAGSDHCRGRAVDIWNWATFHRIDKAKFLRIAARYGLAFRVKNEGWHGVFERTVTPAGESTTPITPARPTTRPTTRPTDGDELMPNYIHISSGADNNSFAVGQRLVQDPATGVFRPLTDGEFGLLEVTQPGIIWAQWSPATAVNYTSRLGLREYTPDTTRRGGVGKLTGRIIFPTS